MNQKNVCKGNVSMDAKQIMLIKLSMEQINKKRNEIRTNFFNKSKNIKIGIINVIAAEDLYLLFDLYDKIFFDYFFRSNIGDRLRFSLSQRMSSNAGKTVVRGNSYEIVIAVKFLFNYAMLERNKKVNGIITTDSFDALQLVFEHELCHVIEFILFKKSSCKKSTFKNLAFNLFGHTDVYHQLPTEREIVGKMYGLKIGDKVAFIVENKKYIGTINSINKRAAVMVSDSRGRYIDRQGNKYTKWYVPLSRIQKINL